MRRPRSTIHAEALYVGPPSRGFSTYTRYRLTIKGDRLTAQAIYQLPSLTPEPILGNVYSLGGFLANWKDIEIEMVVG